MKLLKNFLNLFDSADVLYYDFTKISLNRGGPYIDSPEWLKKRQQ